ncbi:MAG: kynurenine 3-monooxygenase [Phycisphaerales bacterium]|nr:MAG: kynurenine 3-monooxygenase [Phycisphaerales bacterium]
MSDSRPILIVGAGLAGSLLAVLLARQGFSVVVAERRGDPRAKGYAGGRSINLALSVRGITALAAAGIADQILADALPMPGRIIHPPTLTDATGQGTVFQPYSTDPRDAIRSVSRGGLNIALLDAAQRTPGVTLLFEHRCVGVDLDSATATFESPQGTVRLQGRVLIGADGAYSAVRQAMQTTDRFDFSQQYLQAGYKELRIGPPETLADLPPGVADRFDGFAMDPQGLHIWPRGESMMIALPNPDRSFTCTLFWPFEGEHGFERVEALSDQGIRAFFDAHYPDTRWLMPTLVEDFRTNPTSSLVTIRCRPWRRGRCLLLGDAAHAIVPFFGQGMNAAFEDCRIFAEMVASAGGRIEEVLDPFWRARIEHANAIADMAIANFREMSDKVADEAFLYRKRVEQAIHAQLGEQMPELATPLYNLVSFTNVPYAQALARGRRLDEAVQRVASLVPPSRAAEMDPLAWRELVAEHARRVLLDQAADQAVDQAVDQAT